MSVVFDVDAIRVLFRECYTLTLWGIPYRMRPGQAPKDIVNRVEWIYLGQPGWFYGSTGDHEAADRWIDAHRDLIPMGHYEWTEVNP
jgi:hypothetical protein